MAGGLVFVVGDLRFGAVSCGYPWLGNYFVNKSHSFVMPYRP